MSPKQILTVCIRLAALIWALYTLRHMGDAFVYLNQESSPLSINVYVAMVMVVLPLLICVLLWFFPRSVAALLLPGKDLEQVAESVCVHTWQTMFLACIGIWVLAQAIPDAAYWGNYYNLMVHSEIDFELLSASDKSNMLATVLQLIIGLGLVFGAKKLSRLLARLPQ